MARISLGCAELPTYFAGQALPNPRLEPSAPLQLRAPRLSRMPLGCSTFESDSDGWKRGTSSTAAADHR
jgi:hypothetical protein